MSSDPSQHYLFAHRALPQWFHQNPAAFLNALLSEDSVSVLEQWWETVGESIEDPAARAKPAGLRVDFHRVEPHGVVALITLPTPLRTPDAYFVAAVCILKQEPGTDTLTLEQRRFLALEYSKTDPDDLSPEFRRALEEAAVQAGLDPFAPSTKVGEWTQDGYHLTYELEVVVKPESQAFLDAVIGFIRGEAPFNAEPASSSGPGWTTTDPEELKARQQAYESL
jgi:hypothetical protein